MDRGAWQAIVVGVAKKESNTTEQLSHTLHFGTSREFQKNIYFCFIDYTKAFVWITTNCVKFLKRIPDHFTYLLRNLYAGQKATVSTGHGTMDWFKIGKGVC